MNPWLDIAWFLIWAAVIAVGLCGIGSVIFILAMWRAVRNDQKGWTRR